MGNLHSVTLDWEKCIGCTDCIKRCPTEAIRVRNSKAEITDTRCIDCGMCIRVCKSHAKKATIDSLDKIHRFKYKIAIPAPTLYTQFKKIRDPNVILTALKKLGFDEVYEVARTAEIVANYSRQKMNDETLAQPVISSACPAIVKLIEMRFPSLIPNVLPIISPKEASARYAREYWVSKGIPSEDIGIFFISPCAAKVTDSRYPHTIERSEVDGILSIKDVYKQLIPIIRNLESKDIEVLQTSTTQGIGWAATGGEGHASKVYNQVAVDGIDNVIEILERVENDKLDVDFVECLACTNGCLGGPLTVENSFVAMSRMVKIKKYINALGKTRELDMYRQNIPLDWQYPLSNKQVLKLDENIRAALEKMERLEKIYKTLPRIDCGSCGAPTCRALAEDIVQDCGQIEDCIFMLRNKVQEVAENMVALASKMPPSINTQNKNKQ